RRSAACASCLNSASSRVFSTRSIRTRSCSVGAPAHAGPPAASNAATTTPKSPHGRTDAVIANASCRKGLESLSLLLGAETLDQHVGRGGLDDLVELGPVAGDEADALDGDVVGEPAIAAPRDPVVDGDLGAALAQEARAHRRVVAIDGLADERDPLAAVLLDATHVRALQQRGEQSYELVPVRHRHRVPVLAERAPGDLREVEDLRGHAAESLAPGPRVGPQLAVVENGDHVVDAAAELFGGLAGGGRPRQAHAQ